MRVARAARAFAWIALTAAPLAAQSLNPRPFVQWEVRADALFSPAAAQAGFGFNIPTDFYSRLGFTVAAGTARRGDRSVASARADLSLRLLTDPFAENRRGPYIGAGFTTRWEETDGWRPYLLVLVGDELTDRAGWRASIEGAFGGGARLGIVLRRARNNGR